MKRNFPKQSDPDHDRYRFRGNVRQPRGGVQTRSQRHEDVEARINRAAFRRTMSKGLKLFPIVAFFVCCRSNGRLLQHRRPRQPRRGILGCCVDESRVDIAERVRHWVCVVSVVFAPRWSQCVKTMDDDLAILIPVARTGWKSSR